MVISTGLAVLTFGFSMCAAGCAVNGDADSARAWSSLAAIASLAAVASSLFGLG